MPEIERDSARTFVEDLRADEASVVEAVVEDGWPQKMAREGLARHFETWNVDRLAASLEAELLAVERSRDLRLVRPQRIHHIWPALPGAGITPVLVGMLLGIDQQIRPSRRGIHFARRVADAAPWGLIEADERWDDADVIVVSGTDETVAEIRRRMGRRGRVVGYGHRVSLAVVVDGPDVDLEGVAGGIGDDVVMWHQQGCFSVRAVLFCGDDGRRREFCELLADEIEVRERRWDAEDIDDGELASRAQAIGVAELEGDVYCDGIGYVRPVDRAFDGRREAIHSVTVHDVDGPNEVDEIIDLGPANLQGVALGGAWKKRRTEWLEALGDVGATRICGPGDLQRPPADWWHDGRPNGLSLLRVVTVG